MFQILAIVFIALMIGAMVATPKQKVEARVWARRLTLPCLALTVVFWAAFLYEKLSA